MLEDMGPEDYPSYKDYSSGCFVTVLIVGIGALVILVTVGIYCVT